MAGSRQVLSAETAALGADFERAFSMMIRQLNADSSETLLPAFTDDLHEESRKTRIDFAQTDQNISASV